VHVHLVWTLAVYAARRAGLEVIKTLTGQHKTTLMNLCQGMRDKK
jgi:hypothetical protein